MKQHTLLLLAALRRIVLRHKILFFVGVGALVLLPVVLVLVSYVVIEPNSKYILASSDHRQAHVGLVLGAGVTSSGKPYRELQARLDVAAGALQDGRVDRLLLSGDNRFKWYNEPDAMRNYLINVKHIPASKLQTDYAGRSTYESCQRAAQIFQLDQTIIFSASSHLPRAIYLCRHFGIESYGISSNVEARNSNKREAQARVKALFNVYVYGEQTILGSPIPL